MFHFLASVKDFLVLLCTVPRLGSGWRPVWLRNFLFFRRTLIVSLTWVLVEPLMLFGAMGFGVGGLIVSVGGRPYAEFLFPGMVVGSGILIAYFEMTQSLYSRLKRDKYLDMVLLASVNADEVAVGEWLWGATKGWVSSLSLLTLGGFLNLAPAEVLPGLAVISWVSTLLFSALGILIASVAKNNNWFIHTLSYLVLPMYFFSGIFFPVSSFPEFIELVTYLFPLAHAVTLSRNLCFAQVSEYDLVHVSYLLFFTLGLANIAIAQFRTRWAINKCL